MRRPSDRHSAVKLKTARTMKTATKTRARFGRPPTAALRKASRGRTMNLAYPVNTLTHNM